ncbi:MAG: serine/threonine-protein phosphatase, partial [Verrucomicrobiae bacterium]|nr:serine/threonine-protein phosphatase [Verrucomicrobiae bacterium]
GIRSKVRIGYDGRVYKTFRGTDADKRYANEIRLLKVMEERGCDYVPQLIDQEDESLTIVTTNCGKPVQRLAEDKTKELFDQLANEYGVVHDDPFDRNITYHPAMGRFCVIDFELATVLERDTDKAPKSSFVVEWAGMTFCGKRKPGTNEDALAVFASEEGWARELGLTGAVGIEHDGVVFAVSDGMGGHRGGGWASWLAVTELRRFLPAQAGSFEFSAEPLRDLQNAVSDLNAYIKRVAEANPEVKDMGATLVCGVFCRRQMHFAHVGDSRIYCFYDGVLTQLTHDHSQVGELFRNGKINEREARSHPMRSRLNQAIGRRSNKLIPQVGKVTLKEDMWFLFCSDGLIDGLWTARIEREIAKSQAEGRSVEATAQLLLDEAVAAAGKDDTTLFVLKVSSAAAMEACENA